MNDSGETNCTAPLEHLRLLIAVAVGTMLGRILAVTSVDAIATRVVSAPAGAQRLAAAAALSERQRPQPLAAMRALVEHGTYEIDDVVAEPGWDTIDMVKHVGRDGQEHLYSSKPPLLATLMAAPYWVI